MFRLLAAMLWFKLEFVVKRDRVRTRRVSLEVLILCDVWQEIELFPESWTIEVRISGIELFSFESGHLK